LFNRYYNQTVKKSSVLFVFGLDLMLSLDYSCKPLASLLEIEAMVSLVILELVLSGALSTGLLEFACSKFTK